MAVLEPASFNAESIAKSKGALLVDGHFLLSSGLHSDTYFQCAKILQWPKAAEKFGVYLAKQFKDNSINIDVVLAPAMGGLFIGYETSRALGVRSIFVERVDNVFQLKRGFELKPQEKVLIVEDVLTTGKSTLEVIDFIKKESASELVGVGCIADRIEDSRRSELLNELGVPLMSAIKINATTASSENCEGCKINKPLVKPGSRKI